MTETVTRKVVANEADLNRDPISGTPGAHPVGTGAGAASGSVAGAAIQLQPGQKRTRSDLAGSQAGGARGVAACGPRLEGNSVTLRGPDKNRVPA